MTAATRKHQATPKAATTTTATAKTTTKMIESFMGSLLIPSRLTLAHLVIIGIPVFWGIRPLWDSSIHPWMGKIKAFQKISPPSTMFNDRILSESGNFSPSLEAFAVHYMGWHFIYPYELSFVAWILLRKSERGMQHLHETLTVCSFATIFFMSLLQGIHPTWSFAPFEPNFFARMVLCHLVAVSMSWASITWREQNADKATSYHYQDWKARSARWSIPAMAIVTGAGVSGLTVVASVQALFQKHGIEDYFGDNPSLGSQVFLTSFCLGIFHLAVHAFLLYRLRYNIMEVSQLKYLCLYKLVLHLLVPIFWIPEFDPNVHVDKRKSIGIRILLAVVYGLGYKFAGLGDRVGKILAGEKSD